MTALLRTVDILNSNVVLASGKLVQQKNDYKELGYNSIVERVLDLPSPNK